MVLPDFFNVGESDVYATDSTHTLAPPAIRAPRHESPDRPSTAPGACDMFMLYNHVHILCT